jgi:hypothetical protein
MISLPFGAKTIFVCKKKEPQRWVQKGQHSEPVHSAAPGIGCTLLPCRLVAYPGDYSGASLLATEPALLTTVTYSFVVITPSC